jgi:3-oxoadipate enol-lactonase
MPKIKLKNISLYYELMGQGETLVLIGGFGNDHTIWNEVVDKLKNHYQLLLFDNRGAGQSEVPKGCYSIDQMADDVVDLCTMLNICQAHFIGNSMGGFITQNLAFRYPKLVKTATIANASTNIHNAFQVYVKAQLALLKSGVPLKALIQASCSWAFSYHYLSRPGNLKKIVNKALTNPYPFTIEGYKGQNAAVSKFDSRTWVQQISVPVLVLGSDQDLIFLEASVKSLAKQIPHAQYYCFLKCGHIPQVEYPKKFVEVIENFIHQHS